MALFADLSFLLVAAACSVALLAGVVKGLVGFAMPMILISGIGSFISPELALAGLLMPTLVTNLTQGFSQGVRIALRDSRPFMPYMCIGAAVLIGVSQLVPMLDQRVFFIVLGVPLAVYAVSQLAGWVLHLDAVPPTRLQIILGGIGGIFGGLAAIWGPTTVVLLTSLNTAKDVQMRVQGVIYGGSSVLLVAGHFRSGILNSDTLGFSALLIVPAMLGMWLGTRIGAHVDQAMFRRLTLLVLLIAGLNLVRRGLVG